MIVSEESKHTNLQSSISQIASAIGQEMFVPLEEEEEIKQMVAPKKKSKVSVIGSVSPVSTNSAVQQ